MSILPEAPPEEEEPAPVVTRKVHSINNIPKSTLHADTNHSKFSMIESSKYKLPTANSNKILLSANNLSTISNQRFQGNPKFVKMYLPQGSNVKLQGGQNKILQKPQKSTSTDQLAGTNILDIPIVFADNDGFINESLKVEEIPSNSSQISTKVNKNPIKMIVLNKGANSHLHNFNLSNDPNTKSVSNNITEGKYPKLLLRHSPMQNNIRLTQSQQCISSSIDFKNVDLESKLVASKVLKTIPPAVKQINPTDSVPNANNEVKNKILLTVGSRMSVFKSGDKDGVKPVVNSSIIIRPGAQIKAIPMIQAQNILNRSFSIKKNPKCNFTAGQKITIQQISSKDNSDA